MHGPYREADRHRGDYPDVEPVAVPEDMLAGRGPHYVLKVRGDSMQEAGILDGDQVIVEQRNTARNGEIVVALVRGEEATLKRIVQAPGCVTLYPENAAMEPMEFSPDEIEIQGVVVGQMRAYR